MPYRTNRPDRGKAALLVIVVHGALGLALLAGLKGSPLVRDSAEDRLSSFDVSERPPPAPPPPEPEPSAAPEAAGAPDLAARAAQVVVPDPPELPMESPVRTAAEAGPIAGADASAGAAAVAGPGDGAGGLGSGAGGGGTGTGTGSSGGGAAVGARWLSGGLSDRDYRRIRSFAVPRGTGAFRIDVGTDGRPTGCVTAQSSGSPALDGTICAMLTARLRFAPARDQLGRPLPDQITYVANWDRR